jgi:hypothetical protein
LKNHEVIGGWADQIAAVDAQATDFEIRADDFASIVLGSLRQGVPSQHTDISV